MFPQPEFCWSDIVLREVDIRRDLGLACQSMQEPAFPSLAVGGNRT